MSVSRKHFLKVLGMSSLAYPLRSLSTGKGISSIKPNRLKKGSTIGLIAPASPVYVDADFDKMIETLEGLGFKLKVAPHARDKNGYLAGKDEDRVADLHRMFKDPEVEGIICVRGGWGSNRILDLIDFDIIKNNPKVFVGFSDITSLHLAIYTHTGLTTFHGPVGKSDWNSYTWEHFQNVIMKGKKDVITVPDRLKDHAYTITSGKVSGKLLGGNLTVLSATLGSSYIPDWNGAILFVEDVGEDVYRIDRLLSHLSLTGILDQINGFVFGQCLACDQPSNSLSLEEVVKHHVQPRNIPAFYGAMISHDANNATIPIGIEAKMDAGRHTITLLDAAVK